MRYPRLLLCLSFLCVLALLVSVLLAQVNSVPIANQRQSVAPDAPTVPRVLRDKLSGYEGTARQLRASQESGFGSTKARMKAPLLADGGSIFLEAANYNSGGLSAQSVAVADVNGDGRPDLLVASLCSLECASGLNGAVGVLLGNGDGTFQAAISYSSGGAGAISVAVADVNGDGRPDLLMANQCVSSSDCSTGAVSVLMGNGDGTFQAAISYSSGGAEAVSLAVADVNGDGRPDLLVANQCVSSSDCSTGGVGVLLGNGDGTFQAAVSYNSGGYFTYTVAVGDVNGDRKLDLIVANECQNSGCSGPGEISVLLGNGDGTFRAAISYNSGGLATQSVAVADVNGDGRLDLLVANECLNSSNCSTGGVSVLLGNGDGTFQAAVNYNSGGVRAISIAVADVNGDGHPDLLVTNECGGNSGECTGSDSVVSVLLGKRDGTFQFQSVTTQVVKLPLGLRSRISMTTAIPICW